MKIAAPQIVPARVLLVPFAAFLLTVSTPTSQFSEIDLQHKQDEATKDISGGWLQSTKAVGDSTWKISKNPDGTYKAVESGLGEAIGTATLEGTVLTIRCATADGAYAATFQWTLNKDLTSGTGKLTFHKTPRNDGKYVYDSTVFRILPPVWQRWWFISLVALLIVAGAYGTHRYRLRRLIELERVRTRVASDLHDDIGSNLSLIAGLSEVLEQQARPRDPQMAEKLSVIASVSRRSVDAMSDIVWAVNPKLDNLADLAHRMRRFASDSFTARNIEFHFDALEPERNVRVGAEIRREIFLVFKEAMSNALRHSGCSRAEVALQIDRGMIVLKLSDDGPGFDEAAVSPGQGLASMRHRAEKLNGELLVISKPGAGTTVMLKAPLDPKG